MNENEPRYPCTSEGAHLFPASAAITDLIDTFPHMPSTYLESPAEQFSPQMPVPLLFSAYWLPLHLASFPTCMQVWPRNEGTLVSLPPGPPSKNSRWELVNDCPASPSWGRWQCGGMVRMVSPKFPWRTEPRLPTGIAHLLACLLAELTLLFYCSVFSLVPPGIASQTICSQVIVSSPCLLGWGNLT